MPLFPANDALSPMDQPAVARRLTSRRLFQLTAVVVVFAVVIFAYLSIGLNKSVTILANHTSFHTVSRQPFTEIIPIDGRLIPERTVYVDSVDGGRVVSVHAEPGEKVTGGKSLLTLRNTSLELRVMASEAQFAEQVSNLARAQIEFDQTGLQYAQQLADIELQIDLSEAELRRYDEPDKTGIAQSVIESLELQLRHQRRNYNLVSASRDKDERGSLENLTQLDASVKRMKKGLDIQRENLERLAIRAPIDGLLTGFDIAVGEVISPGQRLGQLDQTGTLKVRATVDEFYLGRLFVGQRATTEISGTMRVLNVQKVYPKVENRQIQVDLIFVTTKMESLRIGQSLRIKIEAGAAEEILVIPNGAYLDTSAGKWVFVRSHDRRAAERRAITIARRNSDLVEVTAGLAEGDEILTSAYDALTHAESVSFDPN